MAMKFDTKQAITPLV